MKPLNLISKLEKIVGPDLLDLEKNIIIPHGQGFIAFGKYNIIAESNFFRVVKGHDEVGEFAEKRTALSWCVADKFQQHTLANDLLLLSDAYIRLRDDVKVRQHLSKNISNRLLKEAIDLKINTRKTRLQHVAMRLNKCVNLAKYWQLRGFNNETARTGRTASSRTSR